MTQGTSQKMEKKDCKNWNSTIGIVDQKVYSEAISLTRGFINKTGTMPISMGILTGMGTICRVPPLAKELQATNGCRGRRISPFQG